MSDPSPREESLFQSARAITDPAARREYLNDACAGDQPLRQRIDALLAEHDQLGSFLEASPAAILPSPLGGGAGSEDAATIDRPGERPGLRIGRYRLLEQLGEGGMGTVWVAEQTEPVKRRVALKLIKAGMDSRQVLSRFEAERQALALMDHPNIAKFIDAGAVDPLSRRDRAANDCDPPLNPQSVIPNPQLPPGRPYFVMEYVKGVPITEYCDSARLPIAERLTLFVAVCQAVQHAHQKGVIHRDLKPSNILVCLYDGQPVPKVIDFGLAKAMHQPLTEHTLYTAHGLMVGTPLYMSPEQAEFNNLDVDTRTDIYSLGVILYELLTGTTPLEKQQFKNAALVEILRLIKDVEPQRPSLKLSTSASLPSIAAQRSLDPSQLSRTIRGDLDWIVMKSLEKERSRRYETAGSLARDVERYLSDEPVQARPPSSRYRLKKFIARNKAAFVAGLVIAASLLLGTVVSIWQAVRATVAEKQAQSNLEIVKQVAREWATSETLSGDPKRAEAAIRVAEAAKVSKAWTEILRAQSEIDQGLYSRPLERLAPISEKHYPGGDEDSRLAAMSLSTYAHSMNGNTYEPLQYFEKLKTFQHEPGPEASLFMALVEMLVEPDQAIKTLDAALKKRPYPAALLIRASALTHKAAQDKDYAPIEEALKDLKYGETFAGDSGSVLMTKLRIHTIGKLVSGRLGKKIETDKHRTQLRLLTAQSDKLPKSPSGALWFGAAALQSGQGYDKLFEFGKGIDWRDSPLILFSAAMIHRLPGEPAELLRRFERVKFDADNPYALVAKAHFLADIPARRAELPLLYQRIIDAHPKSAPARLYALHILALMKEPELLRREAGKCLRSPMSESELALAGGSFRFLAGELDEERALNLTAQFQLCQMQYTVAIHYLAAGDREKARQHFEKSNQTQQDQCVEYQWASNYIAKMKRDPNWPSWIEKKSSAE